MKVGPHVMTHSHRNNEHHHDRDVVPRVGSAQAGGNLKLIQCQLMLLLHARRCQQRHEIMLASANNQGNNQRQQNVTNNMARALLLNVSLRKKLITNIYFRIFCPVRFKHNFYETLCSAPFDTVE